MMDSIVQGAIAGLIAALATTFILGAARVVYNGLERHREARIIREILVEGSKLVLETEDAPVENMQAVLPADKLRAARYNRMLKKVGFALEKRVKHLRIDQIEELYYALDWHNTEGLHVTKRTDGRIEFHNVPDGQWPGTTMTTEIAKHRFEQIQAVSWLNLI